MAYSATLELAETTGPAPEAPRAIDRANVVLGHGLLVGELLGVPIGAAQRVLDAASVRDVAELAAPALGVLRATYGAVRGVLAQAIDAEGRPTGTPGGDALRASDLLEADATGALAVSHRRLRLVDLRAALEELDRMLAYALEWGASLQLRAA
jgi:hypothetical protein